MERLTLIISNKCNMKCIYCYANGGNYKSAECLMDANLANRIFDHFVNRFGTFRQILFFGGEPLLAIHVIESVCIHVESLFQCNKIPFLPKFSIVTNGTLINKNHKFLSLAKKFNFSITVSLDGPKDINNQTRKMKNGRGSFKKIISGLHGLKQENIPYSIECTYTPLHFKENWLLKDLYFYLLTLMPKNVILIEEMFSDILKEKNIIDFSNKISSQWISLFNHAIQDWKKYGNMRIAGPEKILGAIVFKPVLLLKRFCEGGLESFTVNPEGMVYPCHILNNIEEFCLGWYEDFIYIKSDILPKKKDINECKSCLIKNYCQTCPAKMYRGNGGHGFKPIQSQCNINKAIYLLAQNVLYEIP